ncbi:hypothetical protein [Woodsholea maritima]|uniref:hypothetical protein n=1 Tax=Woodsholea maritima TaxID=240237 RepID=UPI0003626CC2|nr:hypothetical protein [Woodsholea maritima]
MRDPSDYERIEGDIAPEPAYMAETRRVRARQAATCKSFEAGPIRKFIWWIWLGFARVMRPLSFLVCLCLAAVLGVYALIEISDATGWNPALGRAQAQIARIFDEAIEEGEDPYLSWRADIHEALKPDRMGRPDLIRARSALAAMEDRVGIDRLGLAAIARGEDVSVLEAQLRSLPTWQRHRRLKSAYEQRLAQARVQGLDPAALIFVSEADQRAYMRGQNLYGRLFREADLFLSAGGEGQIDLAQIPGLAPRLSPGMVLYGDVRDTYRQACALLRAEGVGEPRCQGLDSVGALAGDEGLLRLSALSLALQSPNFMSPSRDRDEALAGIAMVKAAWAAGRLSPQMRADLEAALSVLVSHSDLLRAALADFPLTTVMNEPERAGAQLRAQLGLIHDAPRALALGEHLSALGRLRDETGPVMAIRLMESLERVEEGEALHRLSQKAGLRTLALYEVTGRDMYTLISVARDVPARAWQILLGAIAAFICALTIVLIALWPRNPLKTSFGERVNTLAAWLILGKKV